MPYKDFNRKQHEEARLYAVLTVAEAAEIWHYHPMTIRRAIDTGRLVARQSKRVWLIGINSLIDAFGKPPKDVRQDSR